MSNHRVHMPREAQHWHRDGQSRYGPSLHYLQVFYYPEACTPEMGPTEVIPGSHYLFQHASFMGHYGGMRHSVKTAASAGSIFLTVYSILAPPLCLDRTGRSQSPQVQLLAHRTAGPRLDHRAGLRLSDGRLHLPHHHPSPTVPGMPGRGGDVLLALRQSRRIPHHGRPGLAPARQPQRPIGRLPPATPPPSPIEATGKPKRRSELCSPDGACA